MSEPSTPAMTAEEFLDAEPSQELPSAEKFLDASQPQTTYLPSDLLSRFRRGGAVAVGRTLQGIARGGFALEQAVGQHADVLPQDRENELIRASDLFRLGSEIVEGAQEAFPADPSREGTLPAVVAESAGAMVPTLLSGAGGRAAAAVQYGLTAGEQAAQEAVESGRPDLATKAFATSAPLGAITEGLLGVGPRFIPGLRGAASQSIPRALGTGAVRESVQEGLEQVGQNIIASKVAGYDPSRRPLEGVPMAMTAGAILGGPINAVGAALGNAGVSPVQDSAQIQGVSDAVARANAPQETPISPATPLTQEALIASQAVLAPTEIKLDLWKDISVVLHRKPPTPEGGQRAVQEQIADAGLLRPKGPEVGLQEVAGGDARRQAASEAQGQAPVAGQTRSREELLKDLRLEGVTEENANAILDRTKTIQQVVDEQLGYVKYHESADATNADFIDNPDGTRTMVIFPEAGPTSTPGVDISGMFHRDALNLARDQAVERILDILSTKEVIPDEVQRQTQGQAQAQIGVSDTAATTQPFVWSNNPGDYLSTLGGKHFMWLPDGSRIEVPYNPFAERSPTNPKPSSPTQEREMSLLPGARQAAQAIGQAVRYAARKQLFGKPPGQAAATTAGGGGPPKVPPVQTTPPPSGGGPARPLKGFAEVDKIFVPPTKPKPDKPLQTRVAEGIRTGVASKYRPGGEFEEDILQAYGRPMPKLDLAARFELVAGAGGKAKLDVLEFNEAVEPLLKGIERKDFNRYMFAARAKDRLSSDPVVKQVSDWTIPDADNVLSLLEQKLGPERWQRIQRAGELYQDHTDRALQLQVERGALSQETYQKIKDDTDFYAPFRVMKYALEQERPAGTGRSMDTVEQYAKKIVGIKDPNFKLADMMAAARQQIAISRMLAEKARPMQRVLELADIDTNGIFARRLGPDDAPREGRGVVNVLENGKKVRVEVPANLENALKGPNETTNNFIKSLLQITGNTFRSGATLFHAAFQLTNLAAADQLRLAAMSRLGPRSPLDLYRYPMDFLHAAYASMAGNRIIPGKVPKLYRDFLRSGAAGANLQAFLSPKALQYEDPIKIAKQIGVAESLLTSPARFANAIEETTKVMGLKRAMRLSGAKSGKELSDRAADFVTEVRRYAGSPDFSRKGAWIEAAALNLIFMFLNARIQGTLADVGRLSGTSGIGTSAATLGKLMVGVGLPTALLHILNHLPENREDYELKSDVEKRNYWLIPKGFVGGGGPRYITNPQGERVRDYWRIPKRDIGQLFGNTIEAGMGFAEKSEPERYKKFAAELLENLAPVNIQGRTAQERLESVISSANPLIKVPIEAGTGRNLFLHRDILTDQRMRESSPELQYDRRTSEFAKRLAGAMPDWSPEMLRSPIRVENLIQGLSASLITQFFPTKGIEGRTGFEEWRLLRRFQTTGYVEDRGFVDRVRELRRQQADESLIRDKTSDAIVEANKGNPRGAIQAAIQTFRDDKAGVDRVAEKLMMEAANVTRQDKQLLALAPRQRAQMISEQIAQMDRTNSIKYLGELRKRRVLSDATIEELAKIRLLLKGLNAEPKPATTP